MTREQLLAISARLVGCPFCGSSDVHMDQSEDGRIRIECDNDICMATVCFHAGALFQPSLSMARWNSRKTKSPGVPTVEEVRAYCADRRNGIDAQSFIDYYEARGWKLANGCKVKDWRALVRRWEQLKAQKAAEAKKPSSISDDLVEKLINNF